MHNLTEAEIKAALKAKYRKPQTGICTVCFVVGALKVKGCCNKCDQRRRRAVQIECRQCHEVKSVYVRGKCRNCVYLEGTEKRVSLISRIKVYKRVTTKGCPK
jgi:hypothetical protein